MASHTDAENTATSAVAGTRVALVTGAAQGIGRSVALALADDGLDVAINDIAAKSSELDSVVKEIVSKGRRAIAVPGDVTKEEEVQGMVEKAVKELGGLDVMVANAGIGKAQPFVETTAENMNQHLSVNVLGVFFCLKHAAKQMIAQGRGGRLLVASSVCGTMGTQNLTSYCATKFAVRGIMQTAAIELKQHNITVNAYAPGLIRTPMTQRNGDTRADFEREGRQGFIKAVGWPESTPDAEPTVISSIVSYLCKPEASFITGQTIGVNGGLRGT